MATVCTSVRAEIPAPMGNRTRVESASSLLVNGSDEPRVLFDEVVRVEGVPWIRLAFDQVSLGPGSTLRLTSLADGAVQDLDASALQQWGNSSAFFNGDAVRVELIAGPHTPSNSLSIGDVFVGDAPIQERTICDQTDDRVASSHPAVARMLTASLMSGCTATIYSSGGCMVTAGHCNEPSQPVVQFNVPASLANGALQHPPPEDQYTVDASTLNFVNGGSGNDWGVFQCLPNTQTGLTVYEAQGEFVAMATELPTLPADLTLYGYGTDSAEDNQVQQFSAGPIDSYATTVLRHRADTTGGNSGSAMLNAAGEIIGVHTHAGCTTGGGANSGTSIAHVPFVAAVHAAVMELTLPNGPIDFLDPEIGATLQVAVADGCEIAETVELLMQVDASGYQSVPMAEQGGGVYEVVIPAAPCGSRIDYYVAATSIASGVATEPYAAPLSVYSAAVVTSIDSHVSLDFETAPGWTVSGDAAAGAWERGVPANGNRGDPPSDADGSGQCWVTGNTAGNSDVDAGSTILTSPAYDLTSLQNPYVLYHRWYHNSFGAAPFEDTFIIEVSANDGESWSLIEAVGPIAEDVSGGWVARKHRIADVITPTDTVRFRFNASDLGPGSIVEAGVDAFNIVDAICEVALCGDFDLDGDVDLGDFAVFGQCFGGSESPPNENCPPGVDADCDGDNDVDLTDFATFSQNYTGSL